MLAGCTASDESSDRQSTKSTSGRYTQTTQNESTMEMTTKGHDRRAVTLTHQKRLVDKSIRDVSTHYYSRVFRDEDGVQSIDISNVRNDFPEQDLSRVERFISETDLEKMSLLAVQAELPSPKYELEFDFFSRLKGRIQTIAHLSEGELEGSKPATSTMLIRVPASDTGNLEISLIDVVGAYTSDPLHTVTTFLPPNETLFESLNVGPSNNPVSQKIGVPGGALLTNSELASQFTPEDSSYIGFIDETEFDDSYILAVQATMPNSGYYMLPQTVKDGNNSTTFHIRQQNFGGGLNAEFTHLLLARIHSTELPKSGMAIVQTHDFDETVLDKQQFKVSNDPDSWSEK